MGSCISKCSPRSHFQEDQFELNHVQDKLVISRAQPPPPPPRLTTPPISSSNKISPSPPSPSHSSASSASSFTCTNYTSASTTTTTSSLGSSASSVSSAKIDRSFSNEFLWSCYKENPHVARISSIKEASLSLKALPQKPVLPVVVNNKQPNLKRTSGSITPQKRVRSSSPQAASLARQKSFRREPQKPVITAYSHPSRATMRSPSPSRRFNAPNQQKEPSHMKFVHSRPNSALNLRPHYNNSSRQNLKSTRETETRIHRISSKIDEVAVGEALADYMDTLPEEDIDNPLISLDCFIFV